MFVVRFGTLVVRHASKSNISTIFMVMPWLTIASNSNIPLFMLIVVALASLPSQTWPPCQGASEDKVLSRLKLLHEGVLFLLMREKIRSSQL